MKFEEKFEVEDKNGYKMLKGNQSRRIARPFYSNTKRELREQLSRSPKKSNDP